MEYIIFAWSTCRYFFLQKKIIKQTSTYKKQYSSAYTYWIFQQSLISSYFNFDNLNEYTKMLLILKESSIKNDATENIIKKVFQDFILLMRIIVYTYFKSPHFTHFDYFSPLSRKQYAWWWRWRWFSMFIRKKIQGFNSTATYLILVGC